MTIKPVNFRPNLLEDLILLKLADLSASGDLPAMTTKSDLVRYCIRVAGDKLIDEDDFKEILLHSSRF